MTTKAPPREATGPHANAPRPAAPNSPSPQAAGDGTGTTGGNFVAHLLSPTVTGASQVAPAPPVLLADI